MVEQYWLISKQQLQQGHAVLCTLSAGSTALVMDHLDMPSFCDSGSGARSAFAFNQDFQGTYQLQRVHVLGVSLDPAYPWEGHVPGMLRQLSDACTVSNGRSLAARDEIGIAIICVWLWESTTAVTAVVLYQAGPCMS